MKEEGAGLFNIEEIRALVDFYAKKIVYQCSGLDNPYANITEVIANIEDSLLLYKKWQSTLMKAERISTSASF